MVRFVSIKKKKKKKKRGGGIYQKWSDHVKYSRKPIPWLISYDHFYCNWLTDQKVTYVEYNHIVAANYSQFKKTKICLLRLLD